MLLEQASVKNTSSNKERITQEDESTKLYNHNFQNKYAHNVKMKEVSKQKNTLQMDRNTRHIGKQTTLQISTEEQVFWTTI